MKCKFLSFCVRHWRRAMSIPATFMVIVAWFSFYQPSIATNPSMFVSDLPASGSALNMLAVNYLPPDSRASDIVFRSSTPLKLYIAEHGKWISEKAIQTRAFQLQMKYAPTELVNGPFMSNDQCITEGCNGIISTLEIQIEHVIHSAGS